MPLANRASPTIFDLRRGELVFFRRFPVFFEQNPTLNRKNSFRCTKRASFFFFLGRKKFFLSPKRASPLSSPYWPGASQFGGRFGHPSGICWGLDGDGPRFRPPEGSFANFFAKMANTPLRYRGGKMVPRAQRPSGTNSPLYSTGGPDAANDGPAPRFTMYSDQPSQ